MWLLVFAPVCVLSLSVPPTGPKQAGPMQTNLLPQQVLNHDQQLDSDRLNFALRGQQLPRSRGPDFRSVC